MTLSAEHARRIALAAQGLAKPRPRARPGLAGLRAVVARTQILQLDSVNVLARAHYVPAFSRIGPYDRAALDRMAYQRYELFEYWGRQASLLPVEMRPLMRWRMDDVEHGRIWPRFAAWARAKADVVAAVLHEIEQRGPLGVGDLAAPGERAGPWWGWSDGKTALEWLYSTGRTTVAGRRNFERLYDLSERVLPPAARDGAPPRVEARRELIARAARAVGIGTASDIGGYFSIKTKEARAVLDEMVAGGTLDRVDVDGWREHAYLDPSVRVPRAATARALLSPFDPFIYDRKRVERLFGFDYRIEIYVPEPKRRYGYYVLPFLMGERIVARADLKADRKTLTLRVPGAWGEHGIDRNEVARALADELRLTADWLSLEHVWIGRKGDLATPLRRALD